MKTLTILLPRTKTKTQLKRRKVTLMCFTDGQKLSTKQEPLKTYQNKNWTKFWLTFFKRT